MKFMKLEILMSATAMITAVAAVAVSIVQTDVMRDEAEMEREHQRISVLPSIWIETNLQSNSQDGNAPGEFQLEVKNRGLGPAEIRYFTVKYGGTYLDSWRAWTEAVLDPDKGEDVGILGISNAPIPERYILPDDTSVEAFTVRASTDLVKKMREASLETEFTICYCSFYHECWLAKGPETPPEPIKQCSLEDKPHFTSRWR